MLPLYIRNVLAILPLLSPALDRLLAVYIVCGDGPELREQWAEESKDLPFYYPIKMYLDEIVIDHTLDPRIINSDYIYVRVLNGRICTFAASAKQVEQWQQTTVLKNTKITVILVL